LEIKGIREHATNGLGCKARFNLVVASRPVCVDRFLPNVSAVPLRPVRRPDGRLADYERAGATASSEPFHAEIINPRV